MKKLFSVAVCSLVVPLCHLVYAQTQRVGDLPVEIPRGWEVQQSIQYGEDRITGWENGENYFQLLIRPVIGWDPSQILTEGAVVIKSGSRSVASGATFETLFIQNDSLKYSFVFYSVWNGNLYLGVTSSFQSTEANQNGEDFLGAFDVNLDLRSLTSLSYSGKKYYFGFGEPLSGFMGNEVNYDVTHTHDLFINDDGGNYIGTKLLNSGVNHTSITQKWTDIKNKMDSQDMYVQYSAGHGSHSGLAVGVRYDEIRDYVLQMPAKELIIFIMSCYSGTLVDLFNQKKSVWENWGAQKRTLLVFASSRASEESSTGPYTDPDEPGGPGGSAGSAFGFSLWKALLGYADGKVDGVKDGYLSIGEIIDYTTSKTKAGWNHTPVVTGVYNRNLVMRSVPPKAFVREQERRSVGILGE